MRHLALLILALSATGCLTPPVEETHSLIRAELWCKQVSEAPDSPVECSMGRTDLGWGIGFIYENDEAIDAYAETMGTIAEEFCYGLPEAERTHAIVVSGNRATNKAFSLSCWSGHIQVFELQQRKEESL